MEHSNMCNIFKANPVCLCYKDMKEKKNRKMCDIGKRNCTKSIVKHILSCHFEHGYVLSRLLGLQMSNVFADE